MAVATVELFSPFPTTGDTYTGRWVLTVPPFSMPGGATGPITEFVAIVYDPDDPTAYLVMMVDNATEDLTTGFTFDSDSPAAWVTWSEAARIGPGGHPPGYFSYLPDGAGVWDSTYSLFELGSDVDLVLPEEPDVLPYELVVVSQDGTPFGTLTNGRLNRISWELNGAGTAEVSLATTDEDAALMQPGREVQVYYQGSTDPIWWGVIVRPQAGVRESTWQCAGLLWYFEHRFMGRADRANLLENGDFEDGEDDWSFEGGVTHSIDTGTYHLDGSQSLKLEGATADHIGNAVQIWTHPAGGYPILGDYITASTWVYIPAGDYIGGALSDFGLVVVHRDAGGNAINSSVAEINDDTTKDTWIPLEAGVTNVLPGHTVEVRLFPPHGTAYFDVVTLTYMESLSFGYPVNDTDVTDIIAGIVDYAQNRIFDHGKSDLDIGTAGDPTDVTRQIAYQFAEHRNILDAILEFVRNGDCDISIEVTSTDRTFTVWPKNTDTRTPKLGKGVDYATTLDLDVNVADFSWAVDLENGASSVVLLGPGDGPDRPEGGATDTSLVGGAFTLEIVEQAPDNATIGQLDDRARERVAVAARPEIFSVTTLPGSGVIGTLKVGDTVTVDIIHGWVSVSGTYRVAHIDADLIRDQATITLNVVPT